MQRRQCIIGGVGGSNEIEFVLNFQPTVNLCSLARRSERVWLFKSNNSPKGVICAPFGLCARFLVYFSHKQ